jgi:lipopolysaccharide assembly protein A
LLTKVTRFIKAALTVLIILACVMFAVVNREMVTISLFPLPYSADLPKFLLAILFFTLGIIVGGLMISLKYTRVVRVLKKEHKQVDALKNEVQALREENNLKTEPPQLKSA